MWPATNSEVEARHCSPVPTTAISSGAQEKWHTNIIELLSDLTVRAFGDLTATVTVKQVRSNLNYCCEREKYLCLSSNGSRRYKASKCKHEGLPSLSCQLNDSRSTTGEREPELVYHSRYRQMKDARAQACKTSDWIRLGTASGNNLWLHDENK
jgi:hypothetical protein